jgi:hypothetical protein
MATLILELLISEGKNAKFSPDSKFLGEEEDLSRRETSELSGMIFFIWLRCLLKISSYLIKSFSSRLGSLSGWNRYDSIFWLRTPIYYSKFSTSNVRFLMSCSWKSIF